MFVCVCEVCLCEGEGECAHSAVVCDVTQLSPTAGLVLGIGNRLRSRTSGRVPSSPPPASPSQDRVTAESHPRITRRTSFRKKALESSEDIPAASKR